MGCVAREPECRTAHSSPHLSASLDDSRCVTGSLWRICSAHNQPYHIPPRSLIKCRSVTRCSLNLETANHQTRGRRDSLLRVKCGESSTRSKRSEPVCPVSRAFATAEITCRFSDGSAPSGVRRRHVSDGSRPNHVGPYDDDIFRPFTSRRAQVGGLGSYVAIHHGSCLVVDSQKCRRQLPVP